MPSGIGRRLSGLMKRPVSALTVSLVRPGELANLTGAIELISASDSTIEPKQKKLPTNIQIMPPVPPFVSPAAVALSTTSQVPMAMATKPRMEVKRKFRRNSCFYLTQAFHQCLPVIVTWV